MALVGLHRRATLLGVRKAIIDFRDRRQMLARLMVQQDFGDVRWCTDLGMHRGKGATQVMQRPTCNSTALIEGCFQFRPTGHGRARF